MTNASTPPTITIPDLSGARPDINPDVIKEPQTEADLIINLQRLKEWGMNWMNYAEGLEKQMEAVRTELGAKEEK